MTPQSATPTARKCECGDCVRIRQDAVVAFRDDQGDSSDRQRTTDNSCGWSRAERTPTDMPLRSRIWGADR